ncbi:hypothetical protein RFH39_09910, partial [Acinetobacter baumannii]|uniref:hypothetical protein n=1 Tax=Acinetobacter baumannii TaxID=470 RepID=UPI00280DF2DE
FLAQASSFLNYIAEEAFKDRFVQQSQINVKILYLIMYQNTKNIKNALERTLFINFSNKLIWSMVHQI